MSIKSRNKYTINQSLFYWLKMALNVLCFRLHGPCAVLHVAMNSSGLCPHQPSLCSNSCCLKAVTFSCFFFTDLPPYFQITRLFYNFWLFSTSDIICWLSNMEDKIKTSAKSDRHTHIHFISPYSTIIVATVIQTVINTTYYSQLSHALTIYFFSDTTCSFPKVTILFFF